MQHCNSFKSNNLSPILARSLAFSIPYVPVQHRTSISAFTVVI